MENLISGKSNIIEAMALLSQNAIRNELNKQIFRFKSVSDLFYDFNILNSIEVITDINRIELKFALRENGSPEDKFHFWSGDKNPTSLMHDGKVERQGELLTTSVRYYEYIRLEKFSNSLFPHLAVPNGLNIPSLLLSNAEHKKWVSDFLKSKELAERIALDETNQFFITTHNPYLLLSLIEKTKQENLNVMITQMKDYETRISMLSENQITEVLFCIFKNI